MKVANPIYDVVFKFILRRLHKASASKELCEDMEMEDEILEELATQERLIAYERAAKEKAEAEKERVEAEKARLEKLLKQAGIDF